MSHSANGKHTLHTFANERKPLFQFKRICWVKKEGKILFVNLVLPIMVSVTFLITLNLHDPYLARGGRCSVFLTMQCFNDAMQCFPILLLFLTMFFKTQNIVQTMHRSMSIAHPYLHPPASRFYM